MRVHFRAYTIHFGTMFKRRTNFMCDYFIRCGVALLWYIQHIPKFGSDLTSATSADKYLIYNTTPTVQTSIVLHSHDIDNRKHPGDQFILCNRRLNRRACCVVPQTSRRLDIIVVGFNEFKSCVHRWYSIQETLLDVERIYMIL